MADTSLPFKPDKDRVWIDSLDCDIREINEEDTVPAPPSESHRKWLEQKYGRKAPPPKPPADEQK